MEDCFNCRRQLCATICFLDRSLLLLLWHGQRGRYLCPPKSQNAAVVCCGTMFVNQRCAGLKQRARDEKSQYPVDIRKEDSALVGCFHKHCSVTFLELQHTIDCCWWEWWLHNFIILLHKGATVFLCPTCNWTKQGLNFKPLWTSSFTIKYIEGVGGNDLLQMNSYGSLHQLSLWKIWTCWKARALVSLMTLQSAIEFNGAGLLSCWPQGFFVFFSCFI